MNGAEAGEWPEADVHMDSCGSSLSLGTAHALRRSPPPGAERMRNIFEGIGLAGDFWDPTADMFG